MILFLLFNHNRNMSERQQLKDFLVYMFVIVSGNRIKDVTEEDMDKLIHNVKDNYNDEIITKLCKEVVAVATDHLQVAAQCLIFLTEPVDISGDNHQALKNNIENLLVMYDL